MWRLALRLRGGRFRGDCGLELGHVESLVDDLWHGLDLCAQLLLDCKQVEPVAVRDEVDGQAQVAVAAGAPDAVQVGLRGLGEVKVDDHVDRLDVYASREQV